MKKKTVFGVVLFALLVLQTQMVYAADDDSYAFYRQIRAGDLSRAERILRGDGRKWNAFEQGNAWYLVLMDDVSSARSMEAVRLLQKHNVSWGTTNVGDALFNRKSEELVRHLINIGMPLIGVEVWFAIDGGYGDNLVQFLLEKGGEIDRETLQKAAEKKRWTLVLIMANHLGEDDMNYRYTRADATAYYNSQSSDYRNRNPFRYDPIRSKTALMFAAEYGQRNMVRLLVEKGARVNLRADGGETAASLAYDNGEIEIYNFLKEHGAIDYEPRQVVQQPAAPAATSSTTNIYVQPSAPAQSSAPSTPTLQTGTYAASGTNHTMTLVRISDTSGTVSYYVGGGLAIGSGSYRISNNQITLSFGPLSTNDGLKNKTFIYTITSSTSFSGSGEVWARR